jgi:hypothetical protein
LREGNFWQEFRGGTAGAQPIIARNSLFPKIIKSSILTEFQNFFRIEKLNVSPEIMEEKKCRFYLFNFEAKNRF